MKATLEAINGMLADGVIGNYAIGGAVGATFYLAPAATVDLDVFVTLPGRAGLLVSLSPIYEFLKARGGEVQDEYIVLDGWPVQFLVPANALEEEAIKRAVSADVDGISTRVMAAEHLVAIALNTGRAKDYGRILQFLEQQAVDQKKLNEVLQRHGLAGEWKAFKQRFLGESE
ncbi:MAG TPA: hypothetical protein VGS27_15965 [Candidatus Sulfotelmatobacter sp.]|nr:hypothetical protein [Candidatus Sulfotelmatobacter sp.]